MREFKGNSGVKIVINSAPMKTVKRLRRCIANELLKHSIDVGNPNSLSDLSKIFNDNKTKYLNMIKDILLGMEVSEEFESVIYDCMKECTYKSIKITEQLFDDIPEAREDYDLIVREVIQENLTPFMKGLTGMFAVHSNTTESDQE